MQIRFVVMTESGDVREVATVDLGLVPHHGDSVVLQGPAFDEDPLPQFTVDVVEWLVVDAGTPSATAGVQILLSLVQQEEFYRPWCTCAPTECMPIGVENEHGSCNNCGDRIGPKHLKKLRASS